MVVPMRMVPVGKLYTKGATVHCLLQKARHRWRWKKDRMPSGPRSPGPQLRSWDMRIGSERMLLESPRASWNCVWKGKEGWPEKGPWMLKRVDLQPITVGTALEVTKEELAAEVMVREVTPGLHDLVARMRVRCTVGARLPGVALELLEVFDEGREIFGALPFISPLYLGDVEEDRPLDNLGRVPGIKNSLSACDYFHFLIKIVRLVRGAQVFFGLLAVRIQKSS